MGCVSSRHNRPFRRKSTLKEESSEKRIDDWIQPEVGFDGSSSRGDAKVRLIESEMFSSGRFYAHQIGKILENPEIADDQELRKASSALVNPDLAIDSKVEFIESGKLSSSRLSDHQIEREPEKPTRKKKTSLVVTKDTELKQVSAGWPIWLVSVAGEALADWSPRRANTFEKLEKVTSFFYSS